VLAAVGIVFIVTMLVWLYRLLRPNQRSNFGHGSRRKEHGRRHLSPLERAALYRRNALVGIYFGLVGIALGIFLVIFRVGIFSEHANEVVLGMFVFLAGYAGIIAGCAYWLKAKQWNEAIVFIGLMPLAIVLIPFVRLILLAVPAILPVGMVMMPLILIVVVLALPDRSGVSRRKPLWSKDRTKWGHLKSMNTDSD
jgi:hypothetical protein